jgi:hypothetical protein
MNTYKLIGSGSYHFAGVVSCLHDAGMPDLDVYLLVILFDPADPANGDVSVDLQVDAAMA